MRPISAARIAPIDILLAFCALLAVRSLLVQGLEPLGMFDEGLLLTNAQMMADGRLIYRDFYSNYPPGIFQVTRAAMMVSTAPIWTLRFLTLTVRIGSALGAAWLVGRARSSSFCVATATAVLVMQAALGLAGYAYTFAVLLGLIIIATWPPHDATLARRLLSAALFACLSYLRHDMFVYVMAQLAVLEAVAVVFRKHSFLFGSWRPLAEFAVAVVSFSLLLWLPLLIHTGLSRPLHDLFLDLGDLMKARVLPLPPLSGLVWSAPLNLNLPALIGQRLPLGLAVTTLGLGGMLYAAVRSLRANGPYTVCGATAVGIAFALATVPQAMGRTDYSHVAFGIPLVLAAGLPVWGRRGAQVLALVSLGPWFTEGVQFIRSQDARRLLEGDDTLFLSLERQQIASVVRNETKASERIFVGCTSHRRVLANPLDIYYWTHRPGATRYMQFDPGLVTVPKGQTAMIADLERTKPHLLLRYMSCVWDEPNASMREGTPLLDEYLSNWYAPGETLGSFVVWRRKGGR